MEIPILDLNVVNITLKESEIMLETLTRIASELTKALFEVGFLYVTNHGIPAEQIEACWKAGHQFFGLQLATKQERTRHWETSTCGYLPVPGGDNEDLPNERFDLSRPPDCKEALDTCHNCSTEIWPSDAIPEMETASRSLMSASQRLNARLLLLLGYALTPAAPDTFVRGFQGFEEGCASPKNQSLLRFLHYPAVEEGWIGMETGQLRCGEHTDYAAFTLVFMDSTPGLQVYTRQGSYLDVEPKDDAILVNIGDLLQRWSGDQLLSAKHRVVFRSDTLSKDRYSLVYFGQPDDDVIVTPVVACDEKASAAHYEPVRSADYLHRRFRDTFELGKGLDDQLNIVSSNIK